MQRTERRATAFVLAAVCLVVLLAWMVKSRRGGDGGLGETAVGTAGAALDVESVTLGKALTANRQVAAASDRFAKDDTIYAVVVTRGRASGVGLTARWTTRAAGGHEHLISADTLVVSPAGEAPTVFQILPRKGGWAAGDYQVEILVEGRAAARRRFAVAAPGN
jgi:hypothetical protein